MVGIGSLNSTKITFSMFIFHFLITLVLSYSFFKYSIPFLIKLFPAFPSERGMHNNVKASSGGILFVIIYTAIAIYQNFYLPLLSIPISIIGLLDDKFILSNKIKLIFQILTVTFILIFLKNSDKSFLSYLFDHKFYLYFIFIFLGVAIINFINFMDGIDGLVCGCIIIIFISINGTFHYLFPAIGALTAFLIFNWQPSKIFMGDTGSLFIGSYLVSLIFNTATIIDALEILLLCTPLIADPAFLIIRKLINKKNIFKPHKLHLYQRLVSNGFSHSRVSLIYILSTLTLGIIYNFGNLQFLIITSISLIVCGSIIDKKYAIKLSESS